MAECKRCLYFDICKMYADDVRGDYEDSYLFEDCLNFKNKADFVEVETIKAWLYEMAINNVGCVLDGDFSNACEEIISRLDGLQSFARERTQKERGADKPKITCLNCKHLMFSDMYGECNKQLRIVNPSDTCEYAEPKERGGEK